jgi:hypothetical protein
VLPEGEIISIPTVLKLSSLMMMVVSDSFISLVFKVKHFAWVLAKRVQLPQPGYKGKDLF